MNGEAKNRRRTHLASAVLEEGGAETSAGEAHADALLVGAVRLARLAVEGPLLGGAGRLLDATVVPHDERAQRPVALQPLVERAPLSARHHLRNSQPASLLYSSEPLGQLRFVASNFFIMQPLRHYSKDALFSSRTNR